MIFLGGCTPEAADETSATTKTDESTEVTPDEPEIVTAPVNYATPVDGEEVGVFETSEGRIVFVFYPDIAPEHVKRFKAMIKEGFYDGIRFHRCMRGFMIQGGDPNSKDLSLAGRWGTGGYTDSSGREVNIDAEFNDMTHDRGVLSTARGPDTNSASSQFFIMHGDNTDLDGKYTAWGRVAEGIEVVDKIIVASVVPDPRSGAVTPESAVVLTSARLDTWPLD